MIKDLSLDAIQLCERDGEGFFFRFSHLQMPIYARLLRLCSTHTLFSLWLWLHVLPTLCLKGVGAGRSAGFLIRSMMRGIACCFFLFFFSFLFLWHSQCCKLHMHTHAHCQMMSAFFQHHRLGQRLASTPPGPTSACWIWSCRYQIISTYSTSIWTEISKLISPCLHL